MEWTFRAVVRAFLLVGGSAYLVYGLVDGTTFDVALGAFAAVVGAIGLWSMQLQATDEDADRATEPRGDDDRSAADSMRNVSEDGEPGGSELEEDDLETHGPEDNE